MPWPVTFFERSEFACRCGCGFDAADVELIQVLTELREFTKKPIVVNSGCRCEKHNQSVGGATNSQHLLGKAADIRSHSWTPAQIATYLRARYEKSYGIGEYSSFVHIDVRRNRARWNG